MSVKKRVAKFVFHRYVKPRLGSLVAADGPIVLEYPLSPQPRYGFGKPPHRILYDAFDARRGRYEATLRNLVELADCARDIAARADDGSTTEPHFINEYFTGLDAIALLGFLRAYQPRVFFEIGSGNSTRFARRAIDAFALPTMMVSCDPVPRADIAGVPDEMIRQPVETLAPSIFEKLSPGDILFIDSSHRTFQNSDVTMLFLEVIPELRKGVIVHIHDILLPYDYPPEWSTRFYSEQYLLAAMLLANPARFDVLLPNAFVSRDEALAQILAPIWALPEMARVRTHALSLMHGFLGYSLWLEIA